MPGYVDTNVLVRLVVRDSPAQAQKAIQLIRVNSPVRVHAAIMLEAAFVLQRVYKRGRATVANTLMSVMRSPHFVVDDSVVWTLALDLFTTTSLHLVDCYIAARSLTDRVALLTLDQDLNKVVQRSQP